jgi:tetratricopeptide (TPR) repeat protein
MKIYTHVLLIVLVLGIAFALPGTARAASGGGSWQTSVPSDPDVDKAKIAIKEKNWDKAVELLTKVASRDPRNAEIQNQLGYAERNRGNLAAAFKNYETALTLNPKHRGAHEYIGEAYLMTGNLPKAEEHLAKLDKLCYFGCGEYSDLKAAIAKYKQQHPN